MHASLVVWGPQSSCKCMHSYIVWMLYIHSYSLDFKYILDRKLLGQSTVRHTRAERHSAVWFHQDFCGATPHVYSRAPPSVTTRVRTLSSRTAKTTTSFREKIFASMSVDFAWLETCSPDTAEQCKALILDMEVRRGIKVMCAEFGREYARWAGGERKSLRFSA